jgi:hypothetical protein
MNISNKIITQQKKLRKLSLAISVDLKNESNEVVSTASMLVATTENIIDGE